MGVFPNNTLCCYTAKLPQAIQLDQEAQWEVALVEMIHPTSIKNITEQQNTFYVEILNENVQKFMEESNLPKTPSTNPGLYIYTLKIPAGYYFSGQHLVDTIAERFNASFDKSLTKAGKPFVLTIEYHKVARRLMLKFKDTQTLSISFNRSLFEILGGDTNMAPNFNPKINSNSEFYKYFRSPVELNQGLNLMFVYSDVVEYNVVGHTSVPLLRVIPFKVDSAAAADQEGGNTYHVHREFVHPHYLPVSKSYLDTVNIAIKGDLGQNIPFTKGKVTVKLHFQKRFSNN
jgi:hypothetical protein